MQTLLLSFPGILYSTYFSIMNILKREVLIKEEERSVKRFMLHKNLNGNCKGGRGGVTPVISLKKY